MSSRSLAEPELTEPIGAIADPGIGTRHSVDILADVPGLYSIVALHYSNGTRYDLTWTTLCDEGDLRALFRGIPPNHTYLGMEETNTLGTVPGSGDGIAERTTSAWVPAPEPTGQPLC